MECGVLGNDLPESSIVGEVIPRREFYDYEAKYQDQNTQIVIPAAIDSSLADQIRAESIRAFQAIDACGMARVDFFLEKNTPSAVLSTKSIPFRDLLQEACFPDYGKRVE